VAVRSAGLLLHRRSADELQVLLVHPGGPFWRNKDVGAWQIPKGVIKPGEDPETAARREAAEELGVEIGVPLAPLGEIRQAGGKHVVAFAAELDIDADAIVSNTIEIQWPPRSGRRIEIPEVDAAKWLSVSEAMRLMLGSQLPFLQRLEELVAEPGSGERRLVGESDCSACGDEARAI
jgi:predicted NUDIX family NTP pyrophosphohydrolase